MTVQLSDAETALLGLLSEGPMHPWQIEKVVKEREMRFWTDLSQSTIYKQLRSLRKAKLVECSQEIENGRLRKVYRASKEGRDALLASLRDLLSEPQHLKWRVDLGTYHLHLLPRKEALACLAAYRAKLEEDLKGYRSLETFLESHGCPWHRFAIARRPMRLLEGELRWADEFMDQLERSPRMDASRTKRARRRRVRP